MKAPAIKLRCGLVLVMLLFAPAALAGARETTFPSRMTRPEAVAFLDASQAGQQCDGDFHLRRSFYFGPHSALIDLSIDSDGDVWALGSFRGDGDSEPVVIHRTDEGWERQDPPSGNYLATALDVDELGHVWLSGYGYDEDADASPFVWRFDGSEWTRMPVEEPPFDSHLWDISAVATNDVWTVGDYEDEDTGNQESLTLHWDGDSFKQVQSPSPGYSAELTVVDSSVDRVWTVGDSNRRPLALTWSGNEWAEARFPKATVFNPGDVSVGADGRVWVVGYNDANPLRAKLFTYESGVWSKESIPNPKRHDLLYAVDVAGVRGWAAGDIRGGPKRSFVLRWDGTDWRRARADQPGSSGSFTALEIAPDGTAWGVGRFYGGGDGPRAMVQTACA